MDIELLVVADCPHEHSAMVLLRTALDDVGLTAVDVRTTVIVTDDAADQLSFVGSPTILINGHDPFPARRAPAALACRVYPSVAGAAGVPTLRELRQALKRAAAGDSARLDSGTGTAE